MKLKIILASAGLIVFVLSGCACSKKNVESVPDENTAAEESTIQNTAQDSVEHTNQGNAANSVTGVKMDWKYTNEVIIKSSDPDPIDKVLELAEKSGNGRAEVHFQFEIANKFDLQGLEYFLSKYGPVMTTFEIIVPAGLIQPEMPIRWLMPEDTDTRLIVTGKGDEPLNLEAATLTIGADTLIVRNFRFDHQEYRTALELEVGKLLVAENLSFNDNRYEHHMAFMAEPLMVLKSRAKEGELSNYILRNSSFIQNHSDALLSIHAKSLGKFGRIELDHVVAQNNTNMAMGIDISAKNEVLVHDCELTGSKAAPLLYQILPDPEVVIKDSKVSNRVYGYRPKPENCRVDAKPG